MREAGEVRDGALESWRKIPAPPQSWCLPLRVECGFPSKGGPGAGSLMDDDMMGKALPY